MNYYRNKRYSRLDYVQNGSKTKMEKILSGEWKLCPRCEEIVKTEVSDRTCFNCGKDLRATGEKTSYYLGGCY